MIIFIEKLVKRLQATYPKDILIRQKGTMIEMNFSKQTGSKFNVKSIKFFIRAMNQDNINVSFDYLTKFGVSHTGRSLTVSNFYEEKTQDQVYAWIVQQLRELPY